MAPNPSLSLLSRAQPAAQAQTIFSEKVLLRPLYLKPTPVSESTRTPTKDARSARQSTRTQKKLSKQKSPGKPQPLSAKQKRALQIYAIPKSQQKYAIFVPVWRMWCGYIREILGLSADTASGYSRWIDPKNAGPLLASADFHGAMVEVARSRCLSRVGIKGIVVRDTKFTFEIVTMRDEVKVVPKEHTVFRFEVPVGEDLVVDEDGKGENGEDSRNERIERSKPLVFELYGHFFETRAPERATKKFGQHIPPDL